MPTFVNTKKNGAHLICEAAGGTVMSRVAILLYRGNAKGT
jgi:hypothetical protein